MQQPVTQLLAQWRDGDERAFAQLDGGATEDGAPYLVMEFIEGT